VGFPKKFAGMCHEAYPRATGSIAIK